MNDDYPRLGEVRFSLHDEPRPAMLVSTDTGVEVRFVVSWGEPLERRILGKSVAFADDPDYTRHDYTVPRIAWFADTSKAICLVEPTGRRQSLGTRFEARLTYRFAVRTDADGVQYGRLNSLRTRIDGLGDWFRVGSVSHERLTEGGETADVLTLRRRDEVTFSRRLNAKVRPTYNFTVSPVPGQSLINDRVDVLTTAVRPRAWREHLDLHESVVDLLRVAGWQRYSIVRLDAQRLNDPLRAMAGNILGDRWAPVDAPTVLSEPSLDHNRFLFEFDDVGARGLRRWNLLRNKHRRTIAAMIHSVGVHGVALETRISEAGAALEYLGHAIAVEKNERPGQHLPTHLQRIAAAIRADVGFDAVRWAREFANVYNNVKHADRTDSDVLTMANVLRESRLMFRVWVATQLGVRTDRIERNIKYLPMSTPFEAFD